VSAPSPATGADAPVNRQAERAGRRSGSASTFQVALEDGRMRHLTWVAIGVGGGCLLLWWLGAVGKAIGVFLLAVAALHVYRFVRTLLHPAGRIEVGDQSIVLPQGLCEPSAHTVPYDQIRHAFFLRRAVPWTRTGPLLVIETSDQVFIYPRDWFSSDSDQRRIALELNRRLGRL
jgi:hypothetical protein